MTDVIDNPEVYRTTYGGGGLNKEVSIGDPSTPYDEVEINEYANDPHYVHVRCIDKADAISVRVHKGTFVQGFLAAVIDFGHLDYLKELIEAESKA